MNPRVMQAFRRKFGVGALRMELTDVRDKSTHVRSYVRRPTELELHALGTSPCRV